MLDFHAATNPDDKKPEKEKAEAPAPPPAARDPFDITPVRKALAVYEKEISQMLNTAEDHQVVDDESNKTAIEMASQAKRLGRAVEDVRKEKIKPYQEYVKSVNNLAKVYTGQTDTIERGLKGKINAHLTKKRLEQLEAERKAQEEARKLQEKLDAEAKEKGLERVEVAVPVMPQKAEPVRTEEGAASQRKEWKWRIVNEDEIPKEYLQVNSVAINKAVRAGARKIPGIEIYQEESVQIRL